MDQYEIDKLLKQIAELKQELEATKKYGLVWDKAKVKEKSVQQCSNRIPILVRDYKKDIEHGFSNNVLIEGDNFNVLTSLSSSLEGQINSIYIDPPYNTGNKDFQYNDQYIDPEDSYRHSKWLNFMYPRLKLARGLLAPDGVLLISIDDHEVSQLRLLADSIFGEFAFVTTIHVELSATQGMKVKAAQMGNIVKNAEYILVYSKDGHKNVAKNILYDHRPDFDTHYNKIIINSELHELKKIAMPFIEEPFKKDNLSELYARSEGFKKFVESHLETIVADDKISGFELGDYPEGKVYEVSTKKRKYLIYNNGNKIRQLLKLSDSYGYCDDFKRSYGLRKIRGDWWKDFYLDMGNVSKEGGVVFLNGKKPVRLIKQLIEITTDKNSMVLDFFAGSGTTGQAVLELNKEDGGHRRFILCTNNENNICTDVTYPRLKTVITGSRPDGSKYSDGIPANLYYFKTDFVDDLKNTDQAKYNLAEKVDSLLCIAEDIFDEKKRNDYSSHYVSSDKKKHLFIYNDYFNKEKFDEFKDRVMKADGEKIVYVFSFDNNVDETLFSDKSIIVKPIPEKIYEIYKEIAESIKRGE